MPKVNKTVSKRVSATGASRSIKRQALDPLAGKGIARPAQGVNRPYVPPEAQARWNMDVRK